MTREKAREPDLWTSVCFRCFRAAGTTTTTTTGTGTGPAGADPERRPPPPQLLRLRAHEAARGRVLALADGVAAPALGLRAGPVGVLCWFCGWPHVYRWGARGPRPAETAHPACRRAALALVAAWVALGLLQVGLGFGAAVVARREGAACCCVPCSVSGERERERDRDFWPCPTLPYTALPYTPLPTRGAPTCLGSAELVAESLPSRPTIPCFPCPADGSTGQWPGDSITWRSCGSRSSPCGCPDLGTGMALGHFLWCLRCRHPS